MRRRVATPARTRFAHSERGFALPTVLFLVLAAFAVASVAVIASIGAQRGTTRDRETKSALAAAEAGVSQALLHYNRIPEVTESQPCLVDSGGQVAPGPAVDGWCPPVSGALGDGTSYSYSVQPTEGALEIVSTGDDGGVTRRVQVTARTAPTQPFLDASVIGLQGIDLDSDASVDADVATNGNVSLGSNASLCGNAQVGVGHQVVTGSNGVHECGEVVEGSISLPPVNQGDVATNNSNGRFFTEDPISGDPADVCWDGVNGNGAPDSSCGPRELVIDSNSEVTLGGANYSLCKLTLDSNSRLYIASGATVRIYFDSPESCGYPDETAQLELRSNSRITPNGAGPTHVALLLVGSETLTTYANLNSNSSANEACTQDFVVYGPRTEITMDSNSTYCGAIAGNSVLVNSNSQINTNNLAAGFELPNTPPHYGVERFVECSAAPATPPDAGC